MKCPDCAVPEFTTHKETCPNYAFYWRCLICRDAGRGSGYGPRFPTFEEADRAFYDHKRAQHMPLKVPK